MVSEITVIQMKENKILYILNGFFPSNNNIEYVNFEENRIDIIDDGAFDNLK